MNKHLPYSVNSISEHRKVLSLPGPYHPLVDITRLEDARRPADEFRTLHLNLYCIALKRKVTGKVRYGQGYYDYDEGIMSFFAPGQIIANIPEEHQLEGWCLAFHPDLLKGYPLAEKIERYNFFSYAINEALFLSEREEIIITGIVDNIRGELQTSIDSLTQDVIIAQIELLLHYCQRFYIRQFNTRRPAQHDVVTKIEQLLTSYFSDDEKLATEGLPTVTWLAGQMNKSPKYLSDTLRSITGRSSQHHIQEHVLKKAKVLLTNSDLSVAEIAYRLGFDFPQSFNKLFRRKTNQTPLAYRQLFH